MSRWARPLLHDEVEQPEIELLFARTNPAVVLGSVLDRLAETPESQYDPCDVFLFIVSESRDELTARRCYRVLRASIPEQSAGHITHKTHAQAVAMIERAQRLAFLMSAGFHAEPC